MRDAHPGDPQTPLPRPPLGPHEGPGSGNAEPAHAPGGARPSPLARLAAAVLPVVAASVLGQVATYPNIESWYAGLTKASFNPPDWVFAPVWTALFALMAFAVWRILRLPADRPGRTTALAAFFVQLALNATWPWMFFAARNPPLGLANIVVQLAAILVAIALFRRLDRAAAWLLVPLAAWVAFAALLNLAVWRLNG
ncbi:TspO/MBR family protein [Chelatococcus reniformis]|uniref:TspO protein n=1 Tax=Chelatococcus reniformis TaxID=1494448 RepID=A0A916UZE8_9HYPH|nr:TspO/MBR family protein [Chelatococcus reniformis]GGC92944.1 hypothetical protein GCM10010994_58450 [Chelatococcus reniformis]